MSCGIPPIMTPRCASGVNRPTGHWWQLGAACTPTMMTVEVRRFFHQLRFQAIEPFNGLFKNVFEWRTQLTVKGLRRSQLLALGAIVLYQLVLLYQHEHNVPLGNGIKPLLRAA